MQISNPNIVIILADDTGYGDPPCYNPDSKVPMERVDQIAREGVRLTDAHSTCALCTPTRYALLTGRYYWRTDKKHALVMPYEPPVIEPERPTLPGILRSAGYESACIGKWHLGFRYPSVVAGEEFTTEESQIDFSSDLEGGPRDVGFDYFYGTAGCSTSDPPYCFIENRKTVSIPTVPSNEELHKLPGFYPGLMAPDWDEERVDVRHVERAVAFVDRHIASRPDDPFLLYLPISAPHNPWLPPDFVRGRSREGARGDMNLLVDWCVGSMYDALEERGVLDDTLFIFTSDNGPMRGESGQRSSGSLRGQKNTAFEGGHRVPFVARWPGRIAPGSISDETICLADFVCTLADITGAELPIDAGEDSFCVTQAILTGASGAGSDFDGRRPALVSDTGGFSSKVGDFAIRVGPWKLIVLATDDADELAKRREPIDDSIGGRLLFNLERDPGEERNLVAEYPGVLERLESLLEETKQHGARFVDYSGVKDLA